MSVSISGSQITFNDASTQTTAATGFGFKNRIINGDMRIDQRNAGASVTQTVLQQFVTDRWAIFGTQSNKFSAQQNAGSVTPPAGFKNYLGCTSLSSYTIGSGEAMQVYQQIEGLNCADLGWGAVGAQTVTLSFWVRSSLTGTFGGAIKNSGSTRSYPYSYTISSANTWEQKTITIPGDTSGTWLTTNGLGISVVFSLGAGASISGAAGSWYGSDLYNATGATSVVGTNGATFYITGVQLEKGSTATSFDYRPYGTELALCQRYYEKSYPIGTAPGTSINDGLTVNYGSSNAGSNILVNMPFMVIKRAQPTMTFWSQLGVANSWTYERSGVTSTATANQYWMGEHAASVYCNVGAAWVVCNMYGHWTASAEL